MRLPRYRGGVVVVFVAIPLLQGEAAGSSGECGELRWGNTRRVGEEFETVSGAVAVLRYRYYYIFKVSVLLESNRISISRVSAGQIQKTNVREGE